MAIDTGTLTNIGFYVFVSIMFAMLALGFNLQWGYTGLFNAGIAGFFLIGAYVAVFAITPPAPPLIIGGIKVYPGHLGGYSLPLPVGALVAMFVSGAAAALFALRGALMGLAGWFFAITINYVEPSGSFAPAVTFSVWVMVIVGGSGNHRGAIIGAFVIYGLEWLSVQLKDLAPKFLADTIPYIRLMLVGVLL